MKTRFVARRVRLERPELVVLAGAEAGRVLPLPTVEGPRSLGSDANCDLVVAGLSPRHAEVSLSPDGGLQVRRLDGTLRLGSVDADEGTVASGETFGLGAIEFRLREEGQPLEIMPSEKRQLGDARGASVAMREVFGLLQTVAPSRATVLLLGETGSGKDVLARAVHAESDAKDGPWVTLDCGAIAPSLVEAELFGYERGAFTGAEERRLGAFERAEGGTLFLDEVGELPLDVQPKLLRALDEGEIRRLGEGTPRKVNVRVVAATKRDLEDEVRRGRFREDLWFRFAIVVVNVPPLRARREDIPLLARTFARAFAERTKTEVEIEDEEIQSLATHDWPGNVRELKNTVERALWLAQTGDGRVRFLLPALDEPATDKLDFDESLSFSEHKKGWENAFEKKFLSWLLARADGSLNKAARLARMDRKHLRQLARRHGLWDSSS